MLKSDDEDSLTLIVPRPMLVNCRINHDNEAGQGQGIEIWKTDEGITDSEYLELDNKKDKAGEEAIRKLATQGDFLVIAQNQVEHIIKQLLAKSGKKIEIIWFEEKGEKHE